MKHSRVYAVALCGLALMLPVCFLKKESDEPTANLFVQLNSDSATMTAIREAATIRINQIVKEELGLPADYDFSLFVPKERNRLTLYYFYDFPYSQQESLFTALAQLEGSVAPKGAMITPEVDLFGEGGRELVVMIDDSRGELLQMHERVKAIAHELNDRYRQTHGRDLYNIAKSEEFAYKPHIGPGAIRLQSIKDRIQETASARRSQGRRRDVILERIRSRIRETVTDEVVRPALAEGDAVLTFQQLSIFQLDPTRQVRAYIKDYVFGS